MAEGFTGERLSFPRAALIPKSTTGVQSFLQKHPQWDGRGVTIAVLDTGIDTAAENLQETPEGKLKILDIIDATGSGDVDTSCVRKTDGDENRKVMSLDGKMFSIPDEWCNPTGNWHVGLKNENELVPVAVRNRTKEQFITDVWSPKQSQLKAQAIRDLENFNYHHSDPNLPLELKLKKEDLEANVDMLDKLSNKIDIPGATLNCIVFHDGHSWSVVIFKSEDGLLDSKIIKPYVETGQTMKLGEVTLSVNVYDEGNMVSLVTAAGAHGTHVASITAAYDSECPDESGVAPGSQVISVKIGDSRLGTMETASSMIRACSMVVSRGVDIVNFSYGEASHWTNKGAVLDLMREVCQKYNTIFVASAGNNGPALSSVGCPGGNTTGLIGVGAFVSPEMMRGEYSMTQAKPGLPYTWSSRGPACDGALGVSVTAPGGAITSVPVWTLKRKQLMNGTSMSSPHVSGCIALLLSALKSNKIPYSPALIKKIIENTATPLGKHDPFSVGHGVIQVDKAYEAATNALPSSLIDFQVTVSGRNGPNGRGIYLREAHEVDKLFHAPITVEPIFTPDTGIEQKVTFELQLALISSESWVLSPRHLIVWNGARQFKIEVDPRNLPSGVHYAEVAAYEPEDDRGPLFRVPVTVVIPEKLTSKEKGFFSVPNLRLERDCVKRFFFNVPKEASWVDLKLSNFHCESRARITVHTIQISPERSFRENENKEQISVDKDGSSEIVLRVVGGYTMELCLTLYWSELKDVTVSLEMTFRCVQPSPKSLIFNSSNMWTCVEVTSSLREEEVFPEFKLTHSVIYKRPTSHKISPLGARDILPSGIQVFQLVLSYMFHLNQTTEVRPEFPLVSDLLYENPYSGQLWMVFNKYKQYKCAGDAYSRQYTTKLDKDDYILRLQVCHTKVSELKKLSDMPLCLHSKLSSSLTLEVTASRYDVMSGPTVSNRTLRAGVSTKFYLRSLSEDKLARCGIDQGDILLGRFTFSKHDKIKKKVAYKLQYIVGPRKGPKSPSVSTEKECYTQEQYDDSLKQFRINWMKHGVLASDELEEEYHDDIAFLLTKLKMLSESENCSYSDAKALAASIYAKIDMNEILAHMNMPQNLDQKQGRECREEKKRQLIECLRLEGSILLQQQPSSDHLQTIYVNLHKLLDKKDEILREFKMKYAEASGHFASLVKMIEEEISVKGTNKELDEKLIHCYRQLNCKEYADLLEQNLIWKYPPDFVPF